MTKRIFWVATVGFVAVLVAGGLFASNMGFKLNYQLEDDATSNSGTTSIALPYNQQTNINAATDLCADIDAVAGGSVVASVVAFIKSSDGADIYTCTGGNNFAIVPGDGYRVGLKTATGLAPVDYIVVGSHDPGLGIDLDAQGTNNSFSGTTQWAYPYHGVAADADALCTEINAHAGSNVVASVTNFRRADDGSDIYTCTGGTNFSLVPGEAYRINVTADVANWVPAHY